MLGAEWKKLLRSGAFRVFFPLLLLAGCLLPLRHVLQPDPVRMVYAAYAGQSPEAVLADNGERLEALALQQELEVLAYLPPEAAEQYISSLTGSRGMSLEELEALAVEGTPRFSQDIYEEMELLGTVQTQAKRAVEYGDYLTSIEEQEWTIRSSSLYRNNSYALALAERTAQAYAGLPARALSLADPTGVQYALGGWMDDTAACGIVILAALCLFCEERTSGMLPLLFSTLRGRKAAYRAKMTLTALLGTGACLLFAAARLAMAGDLGDLSRPIQTIPGFYASPTTLRAGGLLVLSAAQRMLAVLVAGWWMAVLCIALDHPLAVAAAGLAAAASVLCWTRIDGSSWCQMLKYMSFVAMFSDETLLGGAVFVKFGELPMPFLAVYVLVTAGGSILLWVLGSRWFRGAHRALTVRVGWRRPVPKRKLPGLFRMELQKLLIRQRAAVLLAILFLLQWPIYDSYRSNFKPEELYYLREMAAVQGPYSGERHESLVRELSELETLQAHSAPILSDAYSSRIQALQRVLALSGYLGGRSEEVSYVYETGYLALLGKRPIGFSAQQELAMAALCLLLPGLFTLDPETGMDRLIRTTPGWRRLRRRKWTAALTLSAAVFALCWVPALQFILATFETGVWTAPAVSLMALSGLPGWIPLWLAVLGTWTARFGGILLWCGIVCIGAEKTGRYLNTVLMGAALMVLRWFLI